MAPKTRPRPRNSHQQPGKVTESLGLVGDGKTGCRGGARWGSSLRGFAEELGSHFRQQPCLTAPGAPSGRGGRSMLTAHSAGLLGTWGPWWGPGSAGDPPPTSSTTQNPIASRPQGLVEGRKGQSDAVGAARLPSPSPGRAVNHSACSNQGRARRPGWPIRAGYVGPRDAGLRWEGLGPPAEGAGRGGVGRRPGPDPLQPGPPSAPRVSGRRAGERRRQAADGTRGPAGAGRSPPDPGRR